MKTSTKPSSRFAALNPFRGKNHNNSSKAQQHLLDFEGGADPSDSSTLETASVRKGKRISEHSASSLTTATSLSSLSTVSRKRSLRLRFDESLNQYHEPCPEQNLSEDQATLWYSGDECRKMKAANHAMVHRILNRLEMGASSSSGAFSPNDSASSLDSFDSATCEDLVGEPNLSALINAYEACCEPGGCLAMSLVHAMKEYLVQFPVCTGVEHALVRIAVKDKKERRQRLLELVYNLPHDSRWASSTMASSVAEKLRQKSKDITRPARLFALALGQAQTYCDQEEQ